MVRALYILVDLPEQSILAFLHAAAGSEVEVPSLQASTDRPPWL